MRHDHEVDDGEMLELQASVMDELAAGS